MIEIADFTKRFGSFTAVENMNLTIKPGRIFGLLGPNGAGKSTTVKTMVGILKPTEGMILVNGKDITTEPEETKSIIGYVPENPIIFNKLTGIEYLTLVGRLYHIREDILEDKIKEILNLFDLEKHKDNQVISYSRGMVQKLIIASAILHNPQVLILDEPLAGLDANSAAVFKEVIRSFAKRGKTVIFCSHILEVVERLCDEIAVIHMGKLLARGTSREIVEKDQSKNLEEAFIKLTGEKDIEKEAEDIIAALE